MSMDKSEVERIVRESLRPMRQILGVSDIGYVWRVGRNEDGMAGQVAVNAEQKLVEFDFDPEKATSAKALLNTIRHEWIHCMLMEYDHLRDMLEACLSKEIFAVIDVQLRKAHEEISQRIENLLDEVGAGPEKLLKLGNALLQAFDTAQRRKVNPKAKKK